MTKFLNIEEALIFGIQRLSNSEVKDAKLSCEILLSEVVDISRIELYSHFDQVLTEEQIRLFLDFIERRAKSEPIQYIIGYAFFRGLKIKLLPGVLVPRPETELLVEFALSSLNNDEFKFLDLCSGSGCISAAILNERKKSSCVTVDISDVCCKCASENLENLGISNRAEIIKSDILLDDNFSKDFDLVISNPPYVPTAVLENLNSEILNYEDRRALDGGIEGLDFVPQIAKISKNCLNKGGLLALELHEASTEKASEMLEEEGFCSVQTLLDFAGKKRFVIVYK